MTTITRDSATVVHFATREQLMGLARVFAQPLEINGVLIWRNPPWLTNMMLAARI